MPCPQSSQQARSLKAQSPLQRRAKSWRHPPQPQLLQHCPTPLFRSDTGLATLLNFRLHNIDNVFRSIYNSLPVVLHQAFPAATQGTTDLVKVVSTNELTGRPAFAQVVTTVAPSKPGPTLVKVRTLFVVSHGWVFISLFLSAFWSIPLERVMETPKNKNHVIPKKDLPTQLT